MTGQRVSRWLQNRTSEAGVLFLVLAAMLCATLALAYEALSGYRLHQQTTRKALAHFASVATREFSRSASQEMAHVASMTIAMPVWHVMGYVMRPGDRLPSLVAIRAAAVAQRPECDCPPHLPVDSYLRLNLQTGVLESDGVNRTPAELAALRQRFRRYLNDSSIAFKPGGDRSNILFDGPADAPQRAFSIMLMRDPAHRAVALFAAESPIDSIAPVLERAAHDVTLLPPSIIDRSAQDKLVYLSVTVRGHKIFARGDLTSAPYAAADTFNAESFPMVVGVGLSEDAGASLATALGSSRPWWILALMAAALALFAVAFRQLHRGDELSRLRSDFVASVSHELHTPLALVMVYTETLLLERETSGEERRRFLQVILREARRLSRLVDNVMRVTESERGRLLIAAAPTDLGTLLRSVVEDFSALAEARNVRVLAIVTDDLEAMVDPGALRQMVLNLLGNALKFGPDGQQISVRLERAGDEALITVDDQGSGIPRRDRVRVFERYVRLVGIEAGAPSGGGIGLTVVRELAEAQRIRVWIADAPDGGTRMILAIPLAVDPLNLETLSRDRPTHNRTARIRQPT